MNKLIALTIIASIGINLLKAPQPITAMTIEQRAEAAGFGIGVVVCNIRDIKDLHEMEKILTEGHDRLVKEIDQKDEIIERLTRKEKKNE